ncbi:MAG: c-type cytochrome [Aggregatilineaceae bacterium]
MRRLLWVLILLLVGAALAACQDKEPRTSSDSAYQAPEPTTVPAAVPDPERGHTLYNTWRCAGCHGDNAQGQVGGALAGTTLPFEQFVQAVRQTRPPKPAFSTAELADDDVRDIYAWVTALPASPEVAAAVELGPGEVLGMSVWTQSGCDACHGAFAQGSAYAPALVETDLSLDDFLTALRRDVTTIPAHGPDAITDEWAARLYRWLVSGASITGGC